MQVITLTVPFTVSREVVDSLARTAALDVDYWAAEYHWDPATGTGFVVEQDEPGMRREFAAEGLARAMAEMLTGACPVSDYITSCIVEGLSSGGGFSSDAAECVVQRAALGEIVYG